MNRRPASGARPRINHHQPAAGPRLVRCHATTLTPSGYVATSSLASPSQRTASSPSFPPAPADYVDFLTSVTPENQEEFMMQARY